MSKGDSDSGIGVFYPFPETGPPLESAILKVNPLTGCIEFPRDYEEDQ